MPEKAWQAKLYKNINELKSLSHHEAKQLINALTDTLLGDNQLNVAQYNLLYALAYVTGNQLVIH